MPDGVMRWFDQRRVRPHPERGRTLATHPEAVARHWAQRIAANDLEAANLLYAPDAIVHVAGEALRGRRVHGWLSGSGLMGHVRDVETAGRDGLVVVRWIGPAERVGAVWIRVARGEIAEQWFDQAPPAQQPVPEHEATPGPMVEVVATGTVTAAAKARAEQKIRRVLALATERVLYGRVKLSTAPDPAVERPARAQATLDVNGHLVRAHVAAGAMDEAVDLLEARLRDRLAHRAEHEKALRHLVGTAAPGEWRHGQVAAERPEWYPRPADEREVVRRKTIAPGQLTIDEAAFDLEMLAYDFYLFTELATGVAAVLSHLGDGRYRLRRLQAGSTAPVAAVVTVDLDPDPAPTLSLPEAVEWMDVSAERFLLFADRDTGEGDVLYRRLDGHYGLLSSATAPLPATDPAVARPRLRSELERLDRVRSALLTEGFHQETESASVSELSSLDQHPADLGSETFERERGLSLLEDVDDEIADVHRALIRVERGDYGRCEACRADIGDERLEAMPATRFCLTHQAASEVTPGLTP